MVETSSENVAGLIASFSRRCSTSFPRHRTFFASGYDPGEPLSPCWILFPFSTSRFLVHNNRPSQGSGVLDGPYEERIIARRM